MICKCGSSRKDVSATVISFDKDALTVECSAAITCANCYRLLASGNATITLNPFYHNLHYPTAVQLLLKAKSEERK
jgi:hypothetical protein